MHYYKRNLGDYAKKAGRLSMLQHGAYTLLIDACYDRETFPTLEQAIEWTWASSDIEIDAVKFVLNRFFVLNDNGQYVDKIIEAEIHLWHERGWIPSDPRIEKLRPPIDEWKAIRKRIFERDNYTCTYCGARSGELECDHVYPVSRGGNNSDNNLTTACKKCNRDKGSKTVEEWMAQA
jgi:5-methylcytosine-specific restriction endonuclease McrA